MSPSDPHDPHGPAPEGGDAHPPRPEGVVETILSLVTASAVVRLLLVIFVGTELPS